MPNFINPSLYLGNILGIDVTCAVKSDKYLIDVRSDAFHQAIAFGNFGTVGSEINPRPNTVTDILGFVLVTVLLTPCKNILHFRFRKANIQRVRLLLPLAFQVLAFIVGKLVLRLVCKGIVKLGSNLFVQSVVDSSLIGHALELHSLALGRSASLAFCIFHSGTPFFYSIGVSRFLFVCSADFGAWGVPNKHLVFSFAVRRKIQCLLFLLRYGAYFFRLSLSLCSGFRCSVSEFVERMRHLSPPLRSAVSRSRSSVMLSIIIGVNILNWYGAVIAQSGRQFDESGVAFSGTM
ncbi:MAG: hypothetical protein J6B01_12140 [Ruminococcus sp.]|nr:hypothetical protein [Ruminococcus sp.]